MGRVFNRRLIYLTMGINNPNWHLHVPSSVKEDLLVWQQFLSISNGRTCWQEEFIENSAIQLFTDAAGSTGFGAYLSGRWCCAAWPAEWREQELTGNLVLLEIFPVLVALEIWGPLLANKHILLFCSLYGSGSSYKHYLSDKFSPVIKIMRQLVFLALKYNIWLRAKHIPGCQNNLADALSRFQLDRFRWLAGEAEQEGYPCPHYLEYSAVKLRDWLVRSVKQKTWSAYVKVWRTWSEFKKNILGNDVVVLISFMLQQVESKHSPAFSIWIVGYSFIFRARRRTQARNYGLNLGFSTKEANIIWFGLRGARWSDLNVMIAKLHSKWGVLDIIFIHLGGNDIGRMKTIDLINCMHRDLAKLHFTLPDTIIIWSKIISRQPWLRDIRQKPLERCKRKINHNLAKFLVSLNMACRMLMVFMIFSM
ncbi:hypothetical protein XENTR_v10016498 [Xenopus tropicalis]|nr:hypothetical protein XENTR_v10016498 [Xenopus tropicalis]